MPQDRLTQLRSLDVSVLTEIVRQDQRDPTFEIGEWSVERLSDKGISNPDGLFCLSGQGRAGADVRPWRVALKIVDRPDEQDAALFDQDSRSIWYWKREFLAAQSRLLERFPGPIVAPRIYAAVEHADSAWLWMECIEGDSSQPWSLDQYAFVARELGRFNAACLAQPPFPDYPWLCTEHCRGWLATMEQIQPDRGWDLPFVKDAFSASVRTRVERLWDEKDAFLTALTQVPQVTSHFDPQRRNLFIRTGDDGADEIVAVDWAFVGHAALGGDLFALVGSTALLFEVEPSIVPELEARTVDAYLAGLNEAGWEGDPDLARLGYSAWFALWLGAAAPVTTAFWTADAMHEACVQQFGRAPEAVAAGWATLCERALDRADEARRLMAHFRLG